MYKDVKIYHHCSTNFEKKANAVFLMGAFMIAVLKQSAETVCDIFESCRSQLVPFRDASYGNCSYECTVRLPYYLIVLGVSLFEGSGDRYKAGLVQIQRV